MSTQQHVNRGRRPVSHNSQKVSNDPALSVIYNGQEVTVTLKTDGKEIVLVP